MKIYTIHADDGHAWLEVPVQELTALGIKGAISEYSYQSKNGMIAYLEEDRDLSIFARAKGWNPNSSYKNWQSIHTTDSFIRNLPRFKA